MKRFLIFLLTMLTVAHVNAQAAVLSPGLHEAESDSLLTYYTGTGWAQLVDGAYTVVESTQIGDSVSFVVSGSQLVLWRELLASGGATADICVDALCGTFSNSSSIDQRGAQIAYPVTDGATVTITNSDGGILRIDSFLVLDAPTLEAVETLDTRQYVVLADGTVAAVDQVITGGEIVQIAFSAAVIVLLVVLLVVKLWQE